MFLLRLNDSLGILGIPNKPFFDYPIYPPDYASKENEDKKQETHVSNNEQNNPTINQQIFRNITKIYTSVYTNVYTSVYTNVYINTNTATPNA